jgi:hypothetical protein
MFGRKDNRAGDDNPTAKLRLMALTKTQRDLGQDEDTDPRVWMAMMDWPIETAMVTLVSFADGTTSLYFSNGGGIIGAGTHEPVVRVSAQFLAVSELLRAGFVPAVDFDQPDPGTVRFFARTPTSTLVADAALEEIEAGTHLLLPLFARAQDVITAVRMNAAPPS